MIRSAKNKRPPGITTRVNITFVLIGVSFLLLLGRLWYLQLARGAYYRKLSEENIIRLVRLVPPRGMIFDRGGELLVANRPRFDVVCHPFEVKDERSIAISLADILGIEMEVIQKKMKGLQQGRLTTAVLKEGVNLQEIAAIEERTPDLPGVTVKVVSKREYLKGTEAAHMLGYLGEINKRELEKYKDLGCLPGDLIGKSGVEKEFDQLLRGKSGGEQIIVDAHGRRIEVLGRKVPVPGDNIFLTIDNGIQTVCEEVLEGKRGVAITIDPREGRILALASSPGYDPAIFSKRLSSAEWQKYSGDPAHPFTNRAIQGVYPPGSIFKVILAAAALEEKVIGLNDTFTCNGSYTVGRRKFSCWLKNGHGAVNLKEALVYSCDVFFYQLGLKLGAQRIASYAFRFGLGCETGVELPIEKAGIVPTPGWKRRSWYSGDTANLSIGQGALSTTPLQMINVYCALANGGYLYRPCLLEKAVSPDGKKVSIGKKKIIRNIGLSPVTVRTINNALKEVVSRGTGRKAALPDVALAGKTGTAENPHGEDHAWFVAFAPADEPEIVALVLIENGGQGSVAAAPLVKKIMAYYFNRDTQLAENN